MLVREWLTSTMVLAPMTRSAPHVVEDLQHREKLAVLRDPDGEPFRVKDDGLDALAHAASAPLEEPAEPKIFPCASASSSSLKAPCSSS